MNFSIEKSIVFVCFMLIPKTIFAQTPTGFGIESCPVTPIDLVLHSGDSGTPIPESFEYFPTGGFGGATVANKNDSDGDGVVDNNDPYIYSGGVSFGENFDRDLMKLIIYRPQGCPANGEVSLNILKGQGKVSFFEEQNKNGIIDKFKFKCNTLPKTIFMEIKDHSGALGDVEVELKYNSMSDKISATAIWVDNAEANIPKIWATRCSTSSPSCDQSIHNPEPGIGSLSNFDEMGPDNTISLRRAKDGSRYGHGYNNKNKFGIDRDENFGGRILFEYKIFPTLTANDYISLGIDFDFTRRRASNVLECAYGEKPKPKLGGFEPFPSLKDQANDDTETNSTDEDNVPKEGFIYSWDAPGIPLFKADGNIDSDHAFKCVKTTFEEYVRVGIWNNIPNVNANGLFGSRVSNKVPWHCVYYMKSAADFRLEPDNSVASISGIKEKGGTLNGNAGNGTCSIELKSSPKTEGYKIVYTSGKWKFNGTEVAENPNGKWIYDAGNEIKITISEGNIPFINDDKFDFSVFVSSKKLNSTATSKFDDVDSDF